MPALIPTDHYATITWLGVVPDRAAGLKAVPREVLALGFDGPEGEDHGGLTRPSCSRVLSQYPRDTVIRNTRQLCVMSAEELTAIAAAMGVDALDPSYMGATVVIEGIADFTHVPPSSRLQAASGATIVVFHGCPSGAKGSGLTAGTPATCQTMEADSILKAIGQTYGRFHKRNPTAT